MRIVQLVSSLYFGDAVGNDVLAIDRLLQRHGYDPEVYAISIDPRLRAKGTPFEYITPLREDDILIYHVAVASKISDFVKRSPCRRVIRYHNITPPDFFHRLDDLAYQGCVTGLSQLGTLYDAVEYSISDSDFNNNDLRSYGFTCPMETVPIVIPFRDYETPIDRAYYDRYKDGKTNILYLGRMAPNKRVEDVIKTYYYYRKYWNANSRLLLTGNYNETDRYYVALRRFIKGNNIEGVEFTGHISFPQILACYRAADVYLCLSEHEGFCVPLVEAMYFDIPIVAYSKCAVPDTLGSGGLLLKDKLPVKVAGVIDYLLTHEDMRQRVLSYQRERLVYFSEENVERMFMEALGRVQEIGR